MIRPFLNSGGARGFQGGAEEQAAEADVGDHPGLRQLHEPGPAGQRRGVQAPQPDEDLGHQVELQQERHPAPLHRRHVRVQGKAIKHFC